MQDYQTFRKRFPKTDTHVPWKPLQQLLFQLKFDRCVHLPGTFIVTMKKVHADSPGIFLNAVDGGRAGQVALGWQGRAGLAVGRLHWRAVRQGAVSIRVIGTLTGGIATPGKRPCGILTSCSLQGYGVNTGGGRGYGRRVGTKQEVQDLLTELVH